MALTIGVPAETFQGEHRVAMTPRAMEALAKSNVEFLIEPGAGVAAGFLDSDYKQKGARIAANRAEVFASSDIVLQVRSAGANPEAGRADLSLLRSRQVLIGFGEPLSPGTAYAELATRGVSSFAMELMPRITRAQSMDALSSMATIAGYKAVIMAADALPRMFPMLMTAAGTITPARVFVLGAGVAGLQAIASARRLGAVVHAYDVRSAVREQIESLGAKFVVVELDSTQAEDKGGYAKELGEDFYRKQREVLTEVVRQQDVLITTAAVPGKKAPILVTREMVAGMAPGSVIVDIAAERGGNCELTQPGKTVVEGGVSIIGTLNIPSSIPFHASQMYSRNIATFLRHLVKDGAVNIDQQDEITRETLVTHGGEVVNPRVRELLGKAKQSS
ncbi:MAG: Re/Si-specific NAD(P)(+) transhydrogenase subunit alpha [Acidobacteria bacterium]|nr:MAG: Re/Si-specific NAD(P)(+) transhydrogenase subunit alpha [Acidobacteriota bacterium]